MAQVSWAEPAVSDLNEIAEYIAPENPSAARKLVQQVGAAVERLDRHLKSGKVPAEPGRAGFDVSLRTRRLLPGNGRIHSA